MRIISKFRDYYDSVMKSGMDREVVYVRDQSSVELDENYGLDFSTRDGSNIHSVDLILLGYCGQIFKAYSVTLKSPTYSQKHIFHDFKEFRAFMLHNDLAKDWDFGLRSWWPGRYARFENFNTNGLLDLFHKFQVPLFTVTHEHHWRQKGKTVAHLNPSLKELAFYEVKDTYTAYQDIFQYVAGVLNKSENKMVKISDEDKAHKHGFDKWSFRQKGPKKRKDTTQE